MKENELKNIIEKTLTKEQIGSMISQSFISVLFMEAMNLISSENANEIRKSLEKFKKTSNL